MLAILGLVAGEIFPHPFFDGAITGPSIYQFQQTYDSSFPAFWIALTSVIGIIEAISIVTRYESPAEAEGIAVLKGIVP